MLFGAGSRGLRWGIDDISCTDAMEGLSGEPSSPIATTSPPDDKGTLVMMGEADGGRGFLLTGDGVWTLDVCAWKAEKDGMVVERVDGFTRELLVVVGAVVDGLEFAERAEAKRERARELGLGLPDEERWRSIVGIS